MIKEYTLKNYITFLHRLFDTTHSFLIKLFVFLNQKFNVANLFAAFSSYLTDIAPISGRFVSNVLAKYLFANRFFLNAQIKKARSLVAASKPKKILVISDLNIGDAVNIQTAISFLKKIGISQIDYVVNKTAYCLINHNPNISNTFAIFSKANFVSNEEIYSLNRIINHNKYDLVINFCPFLSRKSINSKNFINYIGLSIYVANNYFKDTINHITYAIHNYISIIFDLPLPFEKNFLYLSDASINEAKKIYNQIPSNHKIIMFNIDATSVYTLTPFDIELNLIERLSRIKNVSVILTASFSQKHLQEKIYQSLSNKSNVILLDKSLPIDTYAALIDFCDCFISSDTGGLHIASCFKFNEDQKPLKNQTSIFSIFGATPETIYAYDSLKQNFLKSSQNAISKVYTSKNQCKNITCINKAAKKCKNLRCFYGINVEEIFSDILKSLNV